MKIDILKPKKLSERELQKVILEHPELLQKGSKSVASKLSLDKGKEKVDLMLQNGNTLQIVEVTRTPDVNTLFQAVSLYLSVENNFKLVKTQLNGVKVSDLEVIIIQPDYPEKVLRALNLFKEDLPLKLFTYEAYENEKGAVSLIFNEYSPTLSKSPSLKVSPVAHENNELRELTDRLIHQIKNEYQEALSIEKKGWGYSIKKGSKTILVATLKKNHVNVESWDSGEWVKLKLDEKSYHYLLDLIRVEMKKVA